jgi:hypothetical protein
VSARPCCRDVYRVCYVTAARDPTTARRAEPIAAVGLPRPWRRRRILPLHVEMNLWALELRNSHKPSLGPRAHPTLPSIHAAAAADRLGDFPQQSPHMLKQASKQQYRRSLADVLSTHRSFFAIRFSVNNNKKRWSSPVVFPLTRHPRLSQMRRGEILLSSSSLLQSAFGIHLLMF